MKCVSLVLGFILDVYTPPRHYLNPSTFGQVTFLVLYLKWTEKIKWKGCNALGYMYKNAGKCKIKSKKM